MKTIVLALLGMALFALGYYGRSTTHLSLKVSASTLHRNLHKGLKKKRNQKKTLKENLAEMKQEEKAKKKKHKRKKNKGSVETTAACQKNCPGKDSNLCVKQCRALEECTSQMEDHIHKNHRHEWSAVLKGGHEEWTALLKDFISKAPYGMHYHDQNDFCRGLSNWISHKDGNIGMCVIAYNYRSSLDPAKAHSILKSCGKVGFGKLKKDSAEETSGRRKLQDTPDDCVVTLDAPTSPTTCFVPDPSKYYLFKGSRGQDINNEYPYGAYGFLSHNYEMAASWDIDNVLTFGKGEITNQYFFMQTQCSDAMNAYQLPYAYGANANGEAGPAFLMGGHILQDVDNPALTQAMWRFKQAGSQENMWEISNRQSGQLLDLSTSHCWQGQDMSSFFSAIASTGSTGGCNFCSWTATSAPYGYSLQCYDGSANYVFKNVAATDDDWSEPAYWINSNTTDSEFAGGAPLNNAFCVEEVTNFKRADIINSSAVSFTPNSPSTYASSAKYIKDGLSILSKALGPFTAGASIAVGVIGVLMPGGSTDQTQAIEQFGNEILGTAELYTMQASAQSTVEGTINILNNERGTFACNYVTELLNEMNNPSADGMCNLIQGGDPWTLGSLVGEAYSNGWIQVAQNINWGDGQSVYTARYGWDANQVGITDLTLMLEELMVVYAYIAAKYGYSGSLCDLNTGPDEDICDQLYGVIFVNVEEYQTKFYDSISTIAQNLKDLRTPTPMTGIPNPQGSCDPYDSTPNVVCTYTGGGKNYRQYTWYDVFSGTPGFEYPTPPEQAWYKFTAGDTGKSFPSIDFQTLIDLYNDERAWDMLSWSYYTPVQVSSTLAVSLADYLNPSNNYYKQRFMNICQNMMSDPDEAMQNHTTQLDVPNRCTTYTTTTT